MISESGNKELRSKKNVVGMNKFLLKFKWYRMKHLDKFIPEQYKTVYENIQRGIPNNLQDTITVCSIVEKVKAGVLDE